MIFLSWSKETSRQIAMRTKKFAELVLETNNLFWISSDEIGYGSAFFQEIDHGLSRCNCGILFITPDNIYQPWINYEAGALRLKSPESVVWPILFGSTDTAIFKNTPFEHLQILLFEKDGLLNLLLNIAMVEQVPISKEKIRSHFKDLWSSYSDDIFSFLDMDKGNDLMSPNEARLHFVQHWNVECESGDVIYVTSHFETYDMYRFLIQNATKRLWVFGRKNRKLGNRDNLNYLKEMSRRIKYSGLDFRLMFFDPDTPEYAPDILQQKRNFAGALAASVDDVLDLMEEANINPINHVRFYRFLRNEAVVIIDNLVLFTNIHFNLAGKAEHLTNRPFYLCDVNNGIGRNYRQLFLDAWEKALPYEK